MSHHTKPQPTAKARVMRVLSISARILSGAFMLLVVGAALTLLGLRIFSFSPYVVLSGSMEPQYPVGSLIYVRKTPVQTLHIGDAITFVSQGSGKVVTHQIVEINTAQTAFVTKGIANDVADSVPVHAEDIIGKVYVCIPYAGYLSAALQTKTAQYGLLFAVGVWGVWSGWKKLAGDKNDNSRHSRNHLYDRNNTQ